VAISAGRVEALSRWRRLRAIGSPVELRKAWSLEFVTMRKARRKVVPKWSVSCNAEPDEIGTCEVINAEASEKGEVARSASESMMREVVVDSCWFVIGAMKRRFSRKIRYRGGDWGANYEVKITDSILPNAEVKYEVIVEERSEPLQEVRNMKGSWKNVSEPLQEVQNMK
jgi:hypothetical protein